MEKFKFYIKETLTNECICLNECKKRFLSIISLFSFARFTRMEILDGEVIDAPSIHIHTRIMCKYTRTISLLRDFRLKLIVQVAWINKEARLMYFNRRSILLGSVPDSSSSNTKEFRHMTLNCQWYIIEMDLIDLNL